MKNKSVGISFQGCEAQQHYFKLDNLLSSLHSNFKQVTLAHTSIYQIHIRRQSSKALSTTWSLHSVKQAASVFFFFFFFFTVTILCICFFLIPVGKNINGQDFRTKTLIRFPQILYNQYSDIYSFRITRSIVFGTYPQASVPLSGKCCFCSSRQGCCLAHFQNILVENKEQI